MRNYRTYLEKTPDKAFANNAPRRLADLELESGESLNSQENAKDINAGKDFLRSAINHYNTYLDTYPDNKDNDLVLYQLSKAYSLVGEQEKSLEAMDKVVATYPDSFYMDEIQFRRGEILFSYGEYAAAEAAYQYVVTNKPISILFEKSRYKLGWSQFKQSRYSQSLETFFGLLDTKRQQNIISDSSINTTASEAEKSFTGDVLRIVGITLSYNTDTSQLNGIFADRPERTYRPLIYKSLGELYLGTGRHVDAANVYIAFTNTSPASPLAPEFLDLAIQAYKQGNFKEETLATMKTYVRQYGIRTEFYLAQTSDNQQAINVKLKSHILELAKYYHSVAKSSKSSPGFLQAASWYALYVESFQTDPDTPHINFLLADAYYDGLGFTHAVQEYGITAYNYPHQKDAADVGRVIGGQLFGGLEEAVERNHHHRAGRQTLADLFADRGFASATAAGDADAEALIKKADEALYEAKHTGRNKCCFFKNERSQPMVLQPATVMVIDDEEVVLLTVTRMLERLGYAVLAARSGQQAVEVLQGRSKIDLVIMDLIMPDIEAGQLLDKIRRAHSEVKVVLSSGYSPVGVGGGNLIKFTDGFLQKPYQLAELSKMVLLLPHSEDSKQPAFS